MSAPVAYTTPAEHLAEELSLLDLCAARWAASAPGEAPAPADPGDLPEQLAERRAAIDARIGASEIFLPVMWFRAIFDLQDFEWLVVLCCAAPYLDERFRRLYAFLNNDVGHSHAGIACIQRMIGFSVQERLAVRAVISNHPAIRDWQIIHTDDLARVDQIYMDASVAAVLTGSVRPAAELAPFLEESSSPTSNENDPPLSGPIADNLRRLKQRIEANREAHYVVRFSGPAEGGQRAAARELAQSLARPLFTLRVAVLLRDRKRSFEDSLRLILREAWIHNAILFAPDLATAFSGEGASAQPGESEAANAPADPRRAYLLHELASRANCTLVCEDQPLPESREAHYPVVDFPPPDHAERRELWSLGFERYAVELKDDDENALSPERLAGLFRFPRERIDAVLRTARDLALSRQTDGRITAEDLIEGCRAQNMARVGNLARPIRSKHTWEDLVLPDEQRTQLRDIVTYFEQRDRVFEDWKLGRRAGEARGYHALFAGPPGTGKTMAAGIIAAQLRVEIYQIDLSRIISKYIGETEKNLDRIFREAEAAQAALFFDEADALFAKRGAVKDARDRHANVETSYLLQRIEDYDGITILATNFLQNLDEAFLRRLHVVVDFPFPDRERRQRIWESMFPAPAPLDGDVDFAFLADRARISGGNIKNIALAAAVQASAENTAIGMRHIIRALRAEYQKIGKPFLEREFTN